MVFDFSLGLFLSMSLMSMQLWAIMDMASSLLFLLLLQTAIANMTAVTKTHGPAPLAFIILPLVAAFFVDITNSFVSQNMLGFMAG